MPGGKLTVTYVHQEFFERIQFVFFEDLFDFVRFGKGAELQVVSFEFFLEEVLPQIDTLGPFFRFNPVFNLGPSP